jgi:hypothetical protein
MWTDTMITMLPMITVHAQNLKAGREMIIDEPFVDSHSTKLFPVNLPIVVDVVDAQKKGFCFSAARANVTTISHNDHVLQLVVVVKAMGAMFVCMIDVPTGSTFYVGLSIFPSRSVDVVNGFDSPVLDAPLCASLALVPTPAPRCVSYLIFLDWLFEKAFFTDSSHGILQMVSVVIKSYYENQVNGKAQRPSRKGVGASAPKRREARTAYDMVSSCR